MTSSALAELLKKVKEDPELLRKLQSAPNLDEAERIAREAGFPVDKNEWCKFNSSAIELSDEDLENVAGGAKSVAPSCKTHATNANRCEGCCDK